MGNASKAPSATLPALFQGGGPHGGNVSKERGAVLIVGLLLLLVVTGIGLTIARQMVLEEKMVNASWDYQRAFEIAESGLAIARERIKEGVQPPPNGCYQKNSNLEGLCAADVVIDPFGPSECGNCNNTVCYDSKICWKTIKVGDKNVEYIIQHLANPNSTNCPYPVQIYKIYSRFEDIYVRQLFYVCSGQSSNP